MPARLLRIAAILALAGTAALADESFKSPSGKVHITGSNGKRVLHVGEKAFQLGDAVAYASIHEKLGNLVLVSTSMGGNACPAQFMWLDTTPGKVGLSESFGTCSDMVEVSHTAEVVTVTMPSMNASQGTIAYDYDGEKVTERMLGLEPAGVAGDDLRAWSGKTAHDYLGAPENEARLIELMGWNMLDLARNASAISSETLEEQSGYLVAGGCMPHSCDSSYAAVALDIETGAPLVAVKQDNDQPRLFGKPRGPLPNRIRQVMTGQ